MTENKMKEAAKLLGVELGEEFRIDGGLLIKYKLDEGGLMFWSEDLQEWIGSNLIEDLLAGKAKIIKILTDVEKRYLSNIIKPFRDKVISIAKCSCYGDGAYFIHIKIIQNKRPEYEYINLPYFEKGRMYRGMQVDKKYTLEELGL